MGPSLSERILARLWQAEIREINPHFRDDYRIAWITVLNAARGLRDPHLLATYAVLGLHPDKVWPAIVARRKAQLGPLYEEFFPEEGLRAPAQSSPINRAGASSPRKPVQSERDPQWKKRAA